jgi:hypothetical protein
MSIRLKIRRSNTSADVLDDVIFLFGSLVGRGGLEPPTSRLSGVRSNHLSYRPDLLRVFWALPTTHWWSLSILPRQDRQHQKAIGGTKAAAKQGFGGAYRDRTDDLLNANQALSQLS